jgi:hypothetical protein
MTWRVLSGGLYNSDDDIVVQDTAVLSLRCPVSGQICKTPARTRACRGLAVFDLDTYLVGSCNFKTVF